MKEEKEKEEWRPLCASRGFIWRAELGPFTAFWSPLEQLVVGRVSVTNRSYQKALW